MQEIKITKADVTKQMYFLLSFIQNCDGPIRSRIGGQKDYMGGILDRYGKTMAESLIFTNFLFPKIKTKKKIGLIRDFYYYEPSVASIAPDLLGITIDGKAIPFVIYEDEWKQVGNYPQVEIKSCKKSQRMLSLVNQHYDMKYLLNVEFNYRLDYLMPFIDKNLFDEKLYNEITEEVKKYNDIIIKSDTNNYINQMKKIDFSNDIIGDLKIYTITKTEEFIKMANLAGKGVTPECLVFDKQMKQLKDEPIPMKKLCNKIKNDFYEFNDNWYNIRPSDRNRKNIVTLNFCCSNIDEFYLLKMNKNDINVRITNNITVNNIKLEPGDYKFTLASGFNRVGTTNEEYFIDKSLYKLIKNCEDELLNDFKLIIDSN